MPETTQTTALSRRHTFTLVAGVTASLSGVRAVAQTPSTAKQAPTPPIPVERARAAFDRYRRNPHVQQHIDPVAP